jgi:hypothetical protein
MVTLIRATASPSLICTRGLLTATRQIPMSKLSSDVERNDKRASSYSKSISEVRQYTITKLDPSAQKQIDAGEDSMRRHQGVFPALKK